MMICRGSLICAACFALAGVAYSQQPLPSAAVERPVDSLSQAEPLPPPAAPFDDAELFTTSPVQTMQGIPAPLPPEAHVPPPAPQPWKTLFYENDFSYICDPCAPDYFGDEYKNVPMELFGHPFMFSFGGQIRHRYAYETNRLRPPGPGTTTYDLYRWRNYFDARGEIFRVYVETIDADIFDHDLPPAPIDRNRWDILNAFLDTEIYDGDIGTGVLRYGRQELLYGAQRLISPLDWSNIRRNFQGAKFFHTAGDWRFDVFSVNPVNAAAGVGPFAEFDAAPDEADNSVRLSGLYTTYTGLRNARAELYLLYLDDTEADAGFADGYRHTLGTRLAGTAPLECGDCVLRTWDYEVEGAYQFGSDNGLDVNAGFFTAEAGHTWNRLPWSPRVGGLFYFGSGDSDPADGDTNTFHVLYPLGHAYWGIIDNLSGQNLLDYAVRASIKPCEKVLVTADYHWFDKATEDDTIYTVSGAPFGPLGAGRRIGQEFDLVGTYTHNANLSVQLGYAHFWNGSAVRAAGPRGDGDFAYVSTTLNY